MRSKNSYTKGGSFVFDEASIYPPHKFMQIASAAPWQTFQTLIWIRKLAKESSGVSTSRKREARLHSRQVASPSLEGAGYLEVAWEVTR